MKHSYMYMETCHETFLHVHGNSHLHVSDCFHVLFVGVNLLLYILPMLLYQGSYTGQILSWGGGRTR